jgi:large subunit ribosomal protein L24
MAKQLHVKKDDTVIVISGKDKGKQGKVVEVSLKEGKVIVEGINIVSKHVKPRRQGETGGIVKVEGAMYADKVAVYSNTCKAGRRTKTVVENGKKIRVCAKCGKEI